MAGAIVIGGGLAGPATALALARIGLGSTVFEAGDLPADDRGAWLTLASNGMDALEALGVADAVADVGFATPVMTLRNGSGRELVRFPSAVDRPDGMQVQTIRRADLYRVLRDACARQGVPIVHGRRLVDAATDSGGRVRATFADGGEVSGDLLVGADGLRSRVRTVIDPGAPGARYAGLLNVGGYARSLDLGQEPGAMAFCFGTRCFLGYVPSPAGDVWWFANPPMRTEPTRDLLAADSAEAWRPRLRELFAGDSLPVPALLDASESLFAGWPTYDIPRVRTWHRDGMVLVGDAVHAASPASGQGASLAVEDAVTLARCLRDRATPAEAFAAYERLRRPRVERVVARGKRTGDAKTPGPVGRWVRDRVAMPVFAAYLARSGAQRDAWLTGHHIDWDSPVAA